MANALAVAGPNSKHKVDGASSSLGWGGASTHGI